MIHLNNLCEDVLLIILEFNGFMCNEPNIFFTNKYFYSKISIPRCVVSNFNSSVYGPIKMCLIHNGYDKYTMLNTLNQGHKKSNLHFQNCKQRRLADKYIFELGRPYHICCGGKGIMFDDYIDRPSIESPNKYRYLKINT